MSFPAGDMVSVTRGGLRAAFSAPAFVGVGAIFSKHVEALSHRQHNLQSLTNCRLWRIDCGSLLLHLETRRPGLLLLILRRYRQRLEWLADEWRSVQDLLTEAQRQACAHGGSGSDALSAGCLLLACLAHP